MGFSGERVNLYILTLDMERVYLLLCKMADKAFHMQGDSKYIFSNLCIKPPVYFHFLKWVLQHQVRTQGI